MYNCCDLYTLYMQNGVTAVDMATVRYRRNIAEVLSTAAEQQQATSTTGPIMTSSTTAEMTTSHTTTELRLVGSVPVVTEQPLLPSTSPLTPVPSHPPPSTSPPTPQPPPYTSPPIPVLSQSSPEPTSTSRETTTPITQPPSSNTTNQTSGIGQRSFEVANPLIATVVSYSCWC